MIYTKKEDLMAALNTAIGESTEQAVLDLIANISDTYDSLGSDLQNQLNEANNKYTQLANDYKKRFFDGTGGGAGGAGGKKDDEKPVKTLTQMLKGE